jgi:hypothetical protein
LQEVNTRVWVVAKDHEFSFNDMELAEDFDLRGITKDTVVPLQPTYQNRIRQHVKEAFLFLDEKLKDGWQTTHGRGPCYSLGELMEELVLMYHNPSAYSVSNLSQAIQSFFGDKPKKSLPFTFGG